MKYYGSLEAGGTKMVLSVLDENGEILKRESIPTKTPEETMPAMIAFFEKESVSALGIACFGPLELDPLSPSFGCITATPKLAWRGQPVYAAFREALKIPVGIDTDVNAAALAEYRLGAAKGLGSCLYVTVGTGVGGGLVVNGKAVHGFMHPEFGHMLLPVSPLDPAPEGFCPYHKGCLEGLAGGPAIEKRWGVPAYRLPPEHAAWDVETDYLAAMCVNAVMAFSPERIVLGGGVMQQKMLFPRIREKFLKLLGGYVEPLSTREAVERYITEPGLGINSGVMGGWLLAKESAERA